MLPFAACHDFVSFRIPASPHPENASTAQQVSAAVEAQGTVARTVADSSARLGAVVSHLRGALVGFRF